MFITMHRQCAGLAALLLYMTAVGAAQSSPMPEGIMGPRPTDVRLGGHLGFVVPVVAGGNGTTTTLADRFTYGFPVGLTIKPTGPLALDFEVVPFLNVGPGEDFTLLLHPGVLYGFGSRYAAGLRFAYNTVGDNDAFGVTPLISKGFPISQKVGGFVEFDLPIRKQQPDQGRDFTSIAFAVHVGLTF
jgi:hypothetical protein